MPSGVAVLACAAGLALAVTSCGTATETSSASTPTVAEAPPTVADAPSTVTDAPPAVSGCPTAPPEAGGTPDWTLPGATGSVAVTGSTDTAAPLVDVTAPFSVTDTQVHTLQAGTGPVVGDTATVSVCYMGVNGRDGTVFDSSYERGAPVEFPLEGVIPGFQKAIAGQTVGSTVAVAMTSADGYPDGQPAAGIQPGDSLIFALEILDATG
ncbi:FKBP-type peptidyl-prolyl cis-trans isomerase [Mycobacterium sp. Y57]|nr:FKBP-type peptidyl-prolyl cis-trans isomerase [Mycolicibacterium xanthum]MBX7434461.1 FKBP-type peptidyl-prolyl cis-trans isomerase [Mycolicibacterium xanthum]